MDIETIADNAEEAQDPYIEEEEEMLTFEKANLEITTLLTRWTTQQDFVQVGRRTRFIEASVEQLQQQGVLRSDETIIPVRVIDTNIRREQPAYINFLINSRRLVTFKDQKDPKAMTQELEDQFTSGMRYQCWEMPFFKEIDGAQAFGWDSVEVEFDLDKPLNVSINHIGNDNLIFPIDSKDIQGSEMIAIRYEVTKLVLKNFVRKYGFNQEQVDEILKTKDGKQPKNLEIFKIYQKIDGVVWVMWYAKAVTSWLKDPVKLYLGRNKQVEIPPSPEVQAAVMAGLVAPTHPMAQPQTIWQPEDETRYPISVLVYNISEQPCITNNRGRIFFDQTKQEAQTGLFSSLINGTQRASNVYASPANATAEGAAPRQLDVELTPGRLFNTELKFWSPPYPDAMLIKASQALDTQTQQETGQVNFAVSNREDSRKTATEISAAQQQSTLLSSVQVSLFSNHIQEVYSMAWAIVQSRALQGKITLLPIMVPDPLTGQAMQKNDVARIGKVYDIKAAGDVDVIERDEKLTSMRNDWPVMQTIPGLNQVFLEDIIRLSYPEDAMKYIAAMKAGDPMAAMVQALGEALRVAVTDDAGNIKPEFAAHKQQLLQLEQQAQEMLAGGSNAQSQQPSQG